MYDTIFFDLDGTLTDSAEGIMNSVKYALREMKWEIPPDTVLRKFIGPPLSFSFMNFCGMDEEQADEAIRQYRVYFKPKGLLENRVYQGIPALLERLIAAGKTLVVATSKPEEFSNTILENFDLKKYFRMICGATMDEKRNTKDAVIAFAIEEMKHLNLIDDSRPLDEQIIMVGDRYHDVEGAKVNGLKCIGVLYGYGSIDELNEAGADYIAENVESIFEFCM